MSTNATLDVPTLHVTVDGTTHPVHEDAQSLKAVLRLEDGTLAEVQVAKVGEYLNVIVAGQLVIQRDANGSGVHILQVIPTP